MFQHVIVFFAVVAVVGCVDSESTQRVSEAQLVIEKVPTTVSQTEERLAKQAYATPAGPTRGEATEPQLPTIKLSAFPNDSQERAAAIDIPILVPDIPELVPTSVITGGPGWYAVSMQDETYGVYLRGTVLERTDPTLPEVHIGTWVSRSHGITTVHFRRDGMSFNLDIECTSPEKDPRCADEDTSLAFADRLLKVAR